MRSADNDRAERFLVDQILDASNRMLRSVEKIWGFGGSIHRPPGYAYKDSLLIFNAFLECLEKDHMKKMADRQFSIRPDRKSACKFYF